MEDWTESEDLERLFESLGILKLHKNNARPSTKGKHEKGLTRLDLDKGGEKGDKYRKFSRSGKNKKGQYLLIRAKTFAIERFLFNHNSVEIEMDQVNGFIEIFLVGKNALGFLLDYENRSVVSQVEGEGLEFVWLDFDQMRYCRL